MNKMEHQTISAALRLSPEWSAWEADAYKQGWHWAETNDTGWMSDGHFASFMEFVRHTKRIASVESKEVIRAERVEASNE